MDFNFIKLARSFIKKNDISEKEKTNEFIRKLEEKFRELFKIKRDSKILNNMNITLFSIYDNLDIMKFNDSDLSNNLSNSLILYPNSTKLQTISSNFKYNFDIFSEHQLTGLNWNNLFVRGDSVLLSLLLSTNVIMDRYYYQKQYHDINFDIELCIYDLDDNQIKEKVTDIQNKIKIYNPYEIKYINTDSMIIIKSQFPFRDIKINLKSYKSPTEILLDSYIDCCAIGYDGSFVWCSPRAHYAITSSKNIYNATKMIDNDYNVDIIKYFKLGFSIEFPSNDFDISGILNNNTLLRNKLGNLLINNDNIDPLINCIIMNDFDQFKNTYNETHDIIRIMRICLLFNRMTFIEYLLKLSTFYDINVLYDLIKFGDVDTIILFLKNYKINNIDKLIIIAINRYLNSYNSDKEISRSIIVYLLSINKNQSVKQNSELDIIIYDSKDDWLIEYCSKIFNLNNNIHKYKLQQYETTNQINNETQQILIESIKTKNIEKLTEILTSDPLLTKSIIHYVCKYDDVDIFKLTMKYMKIYNLESEELQYIYNNNSINCYKWLIEEPGIYTIKNIIIKSNEYLIKYGLLDFLDINFKNGLIDNVIDNNYYIKLAATIGNPKSIMYLSKYQNQSIDHIDENGDTLLHLLMNSTFDSIDQIHSFHIILKSSKIENIINSKNKYGQTPLHKYLMIYRYNYSLIDVMINNGVKLDICDEAGYYPIHTSIIHKNLKALEVLYRYDKNIINMQTDKILYTPLMLSIIHNNSDIAKMLIELNCDQTAKDIYGNTALHYACIYSNCIIFELLKDKQLLENCFKYTYIDYAINRAKLLVSNDDLIVDRINILKCLNLVKKYINYDKSKIDINIIKKMYKFIFMYL